MKNLFVASLVVLVSAALFAVSAVFLLRDRGGVDAGGLVPYSTGSSGDRGSADTRAELERLTVEVERLSQELDRLRGTRDERTPGHLLSLPEAQPEGVGSAAWYLEQYAASFAASGHGGEGAEYFRLAVDAYALQLVEPIADLVTDTARPVALRQSLIGMLATPRFRDDFRVRDALLQVLRTRSPEALLKLTVHALLSIADERAVPGLESTVFLVPRSVRTDVIDGIVQLAGARANESLLRLLKVSDDEATSALILARLNAADRANALSTLIEGSQHPPHVRKAAARKIHEFNDPEFTTYVEDWKKVETDEQVLAILNRTEKPKEIPPWHALRTVGPPDASADADDPNAWATKLPDSGLQWLELTYDPPLFADAVRIFEVNSAGAVAEIRGRPDKGSWRTLWQGVDPTEKPGEFLVTFQTTSFPVRDLRIVLDTTRRSGWNEVDAVELSGPNGSGWATYARASSTYGQ